jgi:hypothetical protein
MPQGLARYGFDENPFFPSAELNPLVVATDLDRFLRIDGFMVLNDLDRQLEKAASRPGPLFFLVTGRDKSGRSSVANYLMARYCEYNAISAGNLIVPARKVDDHDTFSTFKKWLTGLQIALKKINGFPKDLKDDFSEGLNAADRATMGPIFQDLAARSSVFLANIRPRERCGFACCLEKIPTYEIISKAMEIFDGVKTIAIFTAGDYEDSTRDVIWPFKQSHGNASECLVELGQFSGTDVSELVEAHWGRVSVKPNPFDLTGVAKAFWKPRTIAQHLFLLAELLRLKVEEHNDGPEWPNDAVLAFPEKDLPRLVKYAADRAGGLGQP